VAATGGVNPGTKSREEERELSAGQEKSEDLAKGDRLGLLRAFAGVFYEEEREW